MTKNDSVADRISAKVIRIAMLSMVLLGLDSPSSVAEQSNLFALKKNDEAVIKINSGDYKGAIQDLDSAIRSQPDYGLAYSNRGVAYRKLSKYRTALKNYSQALKFSPGDLGTLEERASLREQLSDRIGALRDLDELVSRYSDRDATLLLKRAQFKERSGDFVGAKKDSELAGQKHL